MPSSPRSLLLLEQFPAHTLELTRLEDLVIFTVDQPRFLFICSSGGGGGAFCRTSSQKNKCYVWHRKTKELLFGRRSSKPSTQNLSRGFSAGFWYYLSMLLSRLPRFHYSDVSKDAPPLRETAFQGRWKRQTVQEGAASPETAAIPQASLFKNTFNVTRHEGGIGPGLFGRLKRDPERG